MQSANYNFVNNKLNKSALYTAPIDSGDYTFSDSFPGITLNSVWSVSTALVPTITINNGLTFSSTGSFSNGGFMTMPIPSSKWTITARLRSIVGNCGLIVKGANGKFSSVSVAGVNICCQHNSVSGGWISNPYYGGHIGTDVYLRIVYDQANLYFYYSTDNVTYTLVYTEAKGTYIIEPVAFGFQARADVITSSFTSPQLIVLNQDSAIIPADYFFWLDPANFSGTTWTDKSANAFNFTSAAGTGTTTQNGQTVINLAGSKYLTKTSAAQTLTTLSVVMIGKYVSGSVGANGRPFSMHVGTGLDYVAPRSLPLTRIASTDTLGSLPTDGNGESAATFALTTGTYQMYSSVWKSNGAITNYVNAGPGATYNNVPWTLNIDHWGIGCSVGNPTDSGGLWQAPVGDILFFKRELTQVELSNIWSILARKYKL